MKETTDKNMHDQFENSALRDGISTGFIVYSFTHPEKPNQKGFPFNSTNTYKALFRINQKKEDIVYAEQMLQKEIEYFAHINLMESFGWYEFDISEFITKDGEYWKSFIGTDEEYKKLCKDHNYSE